MAKRADRLPARCAPGWIQAMPDRELHSVAGRLLRESRTDDLSKGQDWLLDRLLDDLEWRRRVALRKRGWPCSCWLCMPRDWLE